MKTAQAFTAEERQQYIGASELAAIAGFDRYKTPLDIYNTKLGLVPAFEGNNHTERGNRLEAIAAEEYTRMTGNKLQRRNAAFVHPVHSFIVGHIDRVFVGERRLAEIKCPSVAAFRRLQREGLSESWVIQAQGYLGLTGHQRLTWIIFCADLWEVASFDIEFDQTVYNAVIGSAVEFWNKNVLPQVPPIAGDADQEKIEFEKIGGQDVTLRNDESFAKAVQMLAEAKQILADGKELEDLAKRAVKDAIEDVCGVYEGGGYRLNYIETKGRTTFDKTLLAAENPTLDLSRYEKTGKPSSQIRIYTLNNSGE